MFVGGGLLQNKQVGSGGGTGQALCRWTQNRPQILGTISFAVCGTHWVGSTVSENRNVIAYWFSIFNGVAAVHCVITHPISSLSSLFSPSARCVKITTMEEELEQQHRNYGMSELWGGARLKCHCFMAQTISHLPEQRVLC